ncbi:MAG: ATPase, T2SS/T4P/T4SS family, partial [Lysobacterales bacterium]
MTSKTPAQLSGLAGRLVADGLLDAEMAEQAQQEAAAGKVPFVTHLVEKMLIDSQTLAEMAAEEFGVPLFDITVFNKEAMPVDLVAPKLVAKHHALPLFRRGNRLFIGVSDPTNLMGLDEIKFHTGINTEAILVHEEALTEAINEWMDSQDSIAGGLEDLDDASLEDLEVEGVNDEADADDNAELDETPIVRFVNKVMIDAIKGGASDIHFEPYEKSYRVRFRTDGVLKEVSNPPLNLSGRLAARLKVMSRMDISERRVPQDGRIKMKLSKSRAIDFRVNTLPTLFGEKIVLRILDPSSAQMGIDALGYEPDQKELFMHA